MQRAIVAVGQAVLWTVLLGFLVLVAIPRFTDFDVFIVRGGSMEPAVRLGSVIIVDRSDRSPRTGEITSFAEADGTIITHRIVGFDGERYTTKGDANATVDLERRLAAAVVGTTVASIPYVGFILHVLRQPAAFLLLLIGTGGFLIIGELRTIGRELRRMHRGTRVED